MNELVLFEKNNPISTLAKKKKHKFLIKYRVIYAIIVFLNLVVVVNIGGNSTI